jgi:site-specific recombinase XerD
VFAIRGSDLYRLKEIMGHADMKTTMKYAHLRPDALIEEMEKCFG